MSDMNEMIILADQTPGKVEFHNFDELKEYMKQGLAVYNETVYSTENIKQAESDLKELKSIKKKLADKKKELEAAYTLPIEVVKAQLDELIDMVKQPMDIIDKMIKENKKAEKEKEILAYADKKAECLGEYGDKILGSKAFFNSKWLNATYKTKDWQADIDGIITNAADSLETIDRIGGKNKSALLARYYETLSLEGADEFIKVLTEEMSDVTDISVEVEDAVIGYKVLKVHGTERQMLQLMTMLELSDFEVEELEDGMPSEMEEITSPEFDSFVAFDIEHTGTFGIDKGDAEAEIMEIGAVKVEAGQIVDKFSMLANPGRKIVPMVARLTHITDDMLKGEPSVDEVITRFKEFAGDAILVGHNIKSCDIPHITRAARRAGVSFENRYFDTKVLANSLKKDMKWNKVTLPYLSECFGVKQEQAHRAWCDAEANAKVFFELKNLI